MMAELETKIPEILSAIPKIVIVGSPIESEGYIPPCYTIPKPTFDDVTFDLPALGQWVEYLILEYAAAFSPGLSSRALLNQSIEEIGETLASGTVRPGRFTYIPQKEGDLTGFFVGKLLFKEKRGQETVAITKDRQAIKVSRTLTIPDGRYTVEAKCHELMLSNEWQKYVGWSRTPDYVLESHVFLYPNVEFAKRALENAKSWKAAGRLPPEQTGFLTETISAYHLDDLTEKLEKAIANQT